MPHLQGFGARLRRLAHGDEAFVQRRRARRVVRPPCAQQRHHGRRLDGGGGMTQRVAYPRRRARRVGHAAILDAALQPLRIGKRSHRQGGAGKLQKTD